MPHHDWDRHGARWLDAEPGDRRGIGVLRKYRHIPGIYHTGGIYRYIPVPLCPCRVFEHPYLSLPSLAGPPRPPTFRDAARQNMSSEGNESMLPIATTTSTAAAAAATTTTHRSTSCPSWYAQDVHLQERRKMITNMYVILRRCVHNIHPPAPGFFKLESRTRL